MAFEKIRASQFDIDTNLFQMDTQVVLEVDEHRTGEYVRKYADSHQRARREDDDTPRRTLPETFDEFYHDASRFRDLRTMLDKRAFGPAEPSMRESILHAQEISFNTGRFHTPEAIQQGMKQYILETFDTRDQNYFLHEAKLQGVISKKGKFDDAIDTYFASRLKIYPIFSHRFDEYFWLTRFSETAKLRKQMAYYDYASYLRNKYGPDKLITLGFSEDTATNLEAVKKGVATELARDPQFANLYPVFYLTRYPNTIEKTWLKTKMEVVKALTAQKSK